MALLPHINPLPLEKARRELTRRGLLAQSECRLTNGLCGIAPVGVDAVVIAGMGGGADRRYSFPLGLHRKPCRDLSSASR